MKNLICFVFKIMKSQKGTAQVEEVVLLALVALGFAGAVLTLGPALLGYYKAIEIVLCAPFP
jgi:Flp pilus assembly pilin Flp